MRFGTDLSIQHEWTGAPGLSVRCGDVNGLFLMNQCQLQLIAKRKSLSVKQFDNHAAVNDVVFETLTPAFKL